jgi:hypothetical protein
MAFQVKDFPSIVASQIAHMRATQDRITDFTVGSVARTLVEAPAIEIDEFYQRLLFGLLESIPIAVFDAFGFAALPALAAAGDVRFTLAALRATPLAVPAGAVLKVGADRRRYLVIDDAEIPAGEMSAPIRVRAEYAGAAGNALAGEIDTLVTSLADQVGVTNPLPLDNGRDEESVEDRKRRFVSYVGSLSRGTLYAIDYAARSTMLTDAAGVPVEYVTQIGIDEIPGHATIYIYASGGVPSPALLDKIALTLEGYRDGGASTPGYRPVGVQLDVRPMTERRLDLALRAWPFSGAEPTPGVAAAMRNAIARAIAATAPGGTLYVEQISDAALSVREIERVAVGMSENVHVGVSEVLLLGDLAVAWEVL